MTKRPGFMTRFYNTKRIFQQQQNSIFIIRLNDRDIL